MAAWGFYGRGEELAQLNAVLGRDRWFFVKITGRRRIGKTALIQRVLQSTGQPVVYFQVPDSGPAGVLSAASDALDTFEVPGELATPPATLRELALLVGKLVEAGYVVALDEFQYFIRTHIAEFASHLQAEVDRLSQHAQSVRGGLIVLGSIHTEMTALLEDQRAPLYNRVTDELELGHLDVASLLELLRAHGAPDAWRILFLWNLFEGVPKFYRDCYEQGVLAAKRAELLRRMFFQSSSPLRAEADNWFLHELRGRYDVVLKYVARHPGCKNGDLTAHVEAVSAEGSEQVGGYIKILRERYRMIERRVPIFSKSSAKNGRYYLRDNFLRSWLAALKSQVDAIDFRPVDELVARADERLETAEGFALERLAGALYEERSRKKVGNFALTARIEGYWDKADTELDLVALNEDDHVVRIGSCKRSADKLVGDLRSYDNHIARFMGAMKNRFDGWRVEKVAIAPSLDAEHRKTIQRHGYIDEDLDDLTGGL
jgi:uncharacterized protein